MWRLPYQFNTPSDHITATVDDHGFGGIAPHNTPYQHSIKVNITQVRVNIPRGPVPTGVPSS